MTRRLALLAACLACAAPASAQQSGLADAIPHPFDVEEAGDRVARSVDALLGMPVGNLMRSLDPTSQVSPSATLEDVAGQGDPRFRETVREGIGAMTTRLADLARVAAAAAPELERSLRQVQSNMAEAARDAGKPD